MADGGRKMREAVEVGTRRILTPTVAPEHEETTVRALAEASLRLAYPGSRPSVTPAPDRPEGMFGVLDVRLDWSDPAVPPITVRVVVHDEMARAAWREVANAIGEAVRTELSDRCPAHPQPHRKNTHTT
jgi:hypothetical protein